MTWYAQAREVTPEELRQGIESALADRGMTLDDLLRQLSFLPLQKGREAFARLFAGEEDMQLVRRVSARLGIDHETLSGEREFTDREEYLRFTFVPRLERVPEHERPTSNPLGGMISMVAAYLQDSAAQSNEEYLREVSELILIDMEKTGGRQIFFGKIIGYAFYHSYDEAIAFSTAGEYLPEMEVCQGRMHAVIKPRTEP
jgi:hypothetical protein